MVKFELQNTIGVKYDTGYSTMHKIAILGCLRERQIKIDCFMHILQWNRIYPQE